VSAQTQEPQAQTVYGLAALPLCDLLDRLLLLRAMRLGEKERARRNAADAFSSPNGLEPK